MKKRGICKILGLAFSVTVATAVIPAQAATQGCNHGGAHSACTVISRELSEGPSYVNPTYHRVSYSEKHRCSICGIHYGYSTEYEYHDYERNYETGMLVCTGCGDSYK